MDGSVAQYSFDMGKLAVEQAYNLINGQSSPEYIPVKIELITKENLN